MNILERPLLFTALLLAACGTTRNVAQTSYHVTRAGAVGSYKVARAVAVGSYRVASAPVRYATGSHRNEPVMVGTTDAIPSDVTQPGQPVSTRSGSPRAVSMDLLLSAVAPFGCCLSPLDSANGRLMPAEARVDFHMVIRRTGRARGCPRTYTI